MSAVTHCDHCSDLCRRAHDDESAHSGFNDGWSAEWDDGYCPLCDERERLAELIRMEFDTYLTDGNDYVAGLRRAYWIVSGNHTDRLRGGDGAVGPIMKSPPPIERGDHLEEQ